MWPLWNLFLGFVLGVVLTVEAVRVVLSPARLAGELPPVPVQCCAMLDVPLSEQVELDNQYGLGRGPTVQPLPSPEAWREALEGAPCR